MAVNQKRLKLVKSRVKPVEAAPHLLHMLVWGRIKSGKTTFLASAPKPNLVFIAESGQLTIRNVKGVSVFPLNPDGTYKKVRWSDAYDYLYFLRYGDHNFKSTGVDTISTLTRIAMRYILKDEEARDEAREPGTPTQPTWGRLQTVMIEFMEELEAICKTRNMHLIYTCHERTLGDEQAEKEGTDVVPDLSPGIRSVILKPPDIIARTYIEEEVDENDLEAEAESLKYGMVFRDAELMVGERVTPFGANKPWLPRRATNVTVPKLLRRIERASKQEEKE